jgi:hypothetical protein
LPYQLGDTPLNLRGAKLSGSCGGIKKKTVASEKSEATKAGAGTPNCKFFNQVLAKSKIKIQVS